MSDCTQVTPLTAFQSSNLNSKVDGFSRLGDRIMRALGAPMINVEIHQDQLYEFIGIACEMYTKYAGFTEEYLVFSSKIYSASTGGIKLDQLFSISPNFNRVNQPSSTVYVAISSVPYSSFTASPTLSSEYTGGIYQNQILLNTDYAGITAFNLSLSSSFMPSTNSTSQKSNAFDYDLMDYRKVVDVYDIEEGSNEGVNSLFTIEQTLAQQTYFSYSMGNYGFDLISWYTMKNWLDTRDKMLAIKHSYTFNPRTQYLTITPAPTINSAWWGIVSCYVERPLADVVKEIWVYQYALALSKMAVASVRSKYSGTTLFGGGSINGTDLMSQGINEKDKLEQKLYEGTAAMGDAAPPMFYVG